MPPDRAAARRHPGHQGHRCQHLRQRRSAHLLRASSCGSVSRSRARRFDSYADDPAARVDDLSTTRSPPAPPAQNQRLAPGEIEPFAELDPRQHRHGPAPADWQVRELGIAVTGGEAPRHTQPVGQLRTFLPWAPRSVGTRPLQVAWLSPLGRAAAPTEVARVWTDDDWPVSSTPTAPGGGTKLAAAPLNAGSAAVVDATAPSTHSRRSRTTVAKSPGRIDPMLVSDVHAMRRRYKVTRQRHQARAPARAAPMRRPGSPRCIARSAARCVVLALPYADPDVVAAVRVGHRHRAGSTHTANDRQSCTTSARPRLLTQYAWPPGTGSPTSGRSTRCPRSATTRVAVRQPCRRSVDNARDHANAHTAVTTGDARSTRAPVRLGPQRRRREGAANPGGCAGAVQRSSPRR